MPKGQRFSGEFKHRTVKDMPENDFGYAETARKYGLSRHERVRQWERVNL